jgi:hypothetical protein
MLGRLDGSVDNVELGIGKAKLGGREFRELPSLQGYEGGKKIVVE